MISNMSPSSRPNHLRLRRERQHRRQNSTPNGFHEPNIAMPPPPRQTPSFAHRRGLSLDSRFHEQQQQDFSAVSSDGSGYGTDNAGPAPTPTTESALSQMVSPAGTPHTRRFTNATTPGLPFYGSFVANSGEISPAFSLTSPATDFPCFDSILSSPNFAAFPEHTSPGWLSEKGDKNTIRQPPRRVSNAIVDRVTHFENMNMPDAPPPVMGPVTENGTTRLMPGFCPPTPIETSYQQRLPKVKSALTNCFVDGLDESMEETLKPMRNPRSNQRVSSIFREMRQQAEALASRQQSDVAATDPVAMFSEQVSGSSAPSAPIAFAAHQSAPATPGPSGVLVNLSGFGQKFDAGQVMHDDDTSILLDTISELDGSTSQGPQLRRPHSHRRTDSLASTASDVSAVSTVSTVSGASVASFASASMSLEETRTDTGITFEDIAQYISGPDPQDNKWVCLYEGCAKRFGRRENIKSHVQTHLNDRQYQCPTCLKCFVRHHDLKRHAKIHSGLKPYPCKCGNSFARHDALTRHRQRGMCIGAFDGVVRKTAKRGRPRKNLRRDLEERREKSERTRRKNEKSEKDNRERTRGIGEVELPLACGPITSSPIMHSRSFTSSQYGSDTSPLTSPVPCDMILDPLPHTDPLLPTMMLDDLGMPCASTMNPKSLSVSTSAMSNLNSILSSDHHSLVNSPSTISHHSYVSHASITAAAQEHSPHPSAAGSHYATPHVTATPGSSPPVSGAGLNLFNLESFSEEASITAQGSQYGGHSGGDGGESDFSRSRSCSHHPDDNLSGLSQHDTIPASTLSETLVTSGQLHLLPEGFVDSRDSAADMIGYNEGDYVSMFTAGDDVFFGNALDGHLDGCDRERKSLKGLRGFAQSSGWEGRIS